MKVISGGQTGADRAGVDAAAALGLPTGGHGARCPCGNDHGGSGGAGRRGAIDGDDPRGAAQPGRASL